VGWHVSSGALQEQASRIAAPERLPPRLGAAARGCAELCARTGLLNQGEPSSWRPCLAGEGRIAPPADPHMASHPPTWLSGRTPSQGCMPAPSGLVNKCPVEVAPGLQAVHPVDPRIHFALNCGANSCPAIKVYSPDNLDFGLAAAAASFCASEPALQKLPRACSRCPASLACLAKRRGTGGQGGRWRR
jgi:hypothetical protein